MRRFLLLVNERARRGRAVGTLQRLLQRTALSSCEPIVAPFVDDAGALRALEQLQHDMTPVAVGGDGTVTSIARILRCANLHDRPMGVLPLGTGNGLCHSLGIRRAAQAADVLIRGVPLPVDVMMTTHPQAPLSLLNIGVGLEGLVMADFERWRSRSRLLGGMIGIGRCGRRISGVRVEVDGEQILTRQDRFCNVGLYNMPCYGFGVQPKPSADPVDGVVDVRLHRRRLAYLSYMAAAMARRASPLDRTPEWPKVRAATISSPMPVQMDGETLSPATFDVEVVPRGLIVIGPTRESRRRPHGEDAAT